MKKLSLASLLLALGGAAALSNPGFAQSVPGAPSDPGTTAPGAVSPMAEDTLGTRRNMQFNDGQILGIMNAVDQHEIRAADMALKKNPRAEVRGYARMLREQHNADLTNARQLARKQNLRAATSPLADSLRAKSREEMKRLGALNGAEFERSYVEAMVKGHEEALEMLDRQLIPSAQNEALKEHLAEARGHFESHLEEGRRLQEERATQAGP